MINFEDWYARYPNKKARKNAEKAWAKLTDADKMAAFHDPMKRFKGVEARFIPHPATYLNGARWEDDDTPATKGSAHQSILEDLNDRSWAT
jgi:hypothetical protein